MFGVFEVLQGREDLFLFIETLHIFLIFESVWHIESDGSDSYGNFSLGRSWSRSKCAVKARKSGERKEHTFIFLGTLRRRKRKLQKKSRAKRVNVFKEVHDGHVKNVCGLSCDCLLILHMVASTSQISVLKNLTIIKFY